MISVLFKAAPLASNPTTLNVCLPDAMATDVEMAAPVTVVLATLST